MPLFQKFCTPPRFNTPLRPSWIEVWSSGNQVLGRRLHGRSCMLTLGCMGKNWGSPQVKSQLQIVDFGLQFLHLTRKRLRRRCFYHFQSLCTLWLAPITGKAAPSWNWKARFRGLALQNVQSMPRGWNQFSTFTRLRLGWNTAEVKHASHVFHFSWQMFSNDICFEF